MQPEELVKKLGMVGAAMIRGMGMYSENQERLSNGFAAAYTARDFEILATEIETALAELEITR